MLSRGIRCVVVAALLLVQAAVPADGPGLPAESATALADDERLAREIREAVAARAAAVPRAEQDPFRPMFHYRPPAQWMNDICGAIHHDGWHHVFYQANPYAADQYGWGWGHARSRDLTHWEELPFALVPMKDRGELRCNSGSIALNGSGVPTILYTSVPRDGSVRSQWAASPLDDDLIRWRRVGGKPVLERGQDDIPADKVHPGWSDPYLFRKDGRTFVTFKEARGMVCETRDAALTTWKFLDFMDGVAGECPNVFELGDRWVILRSTSPLSYLTGDLVLGENDIRFAADGPPLPMDHGFGAHPPLDRTPNHVRGLYGTNVYEDDEGRCILFGWISGFKTGRGWNGCMSLPRILTLGLNGRVVQTPAPELQVLRGAHTRLADVALDREFKLVEGAAGDQLEVVAEFIPGTVGACGLKLRSSEDGRRAITLRYADGSLDVGGTVVPVGRADAAVKLRVFLDRSVMEVFINDGQTAVSRVEYPPLEDLAVGVFAEDGMAVLTSLDVWQMKSVW